MEDEWDYISDKNRIAGLRDELKRKSREGMDLLAERDRLAAENAELKLTDHYQRSLDEMHLRYNVEAELARYREAHAQLVIDYEQVLADLEKSDEALEKLREVVPEGTRWCSDCEKMTLPDADDPDFCAECEGEDVWTRGVLVDVHDILYPKETSDDNAEIQALVTQRRAVKIPPTADGCYNYDDPLCAAIETLLARDNIKTFAAQEVRIAELEAALLGYQETKWMLAGRDKELADTTAELARVKAESLRVVKCGTVCELQDCMTEYCFIEGKDRLNFASEFAKQHYPTMRVQPVRLERWGTEA